MTGGFGRPGKRAPSAEHRAWWLRQMDLTEPTDKAGRTMAAVMAANVPPPDSRR